VLVGADRRGPSGRHRGRVGAHAGVGLSGPTWAELGFLFSREFLIAFLFIFSRVFNSNSNHVKNKINNPSLIKLTLTKRGRERERN
jgi:hypothetical protein